MYKEMDKMKCICYYPEDWYNEKNQNGWNNYNNDWDEKDDCWCNHYKNKQSMNNGCKEKKQSYQYEENGYNNNSFEWQNNKHSNKSNEDCYNNYNKHEPEMYENKKPYKKHKCCLFDIFKICK